MKSKLLFVTIIIVAAAAVATGFLRDAVTSRAAPPQPVRPFWIDYATTLGSGELGAAGGTVDGVPNINSKTEITVPYGTRFTGGGGVWVNGWEGNEDADLAAAGYGDQIGSVAVEVDSLCNGEIDVLGRLDGGGNMVPELNLKQSVTTESDNTDGTEPEDFLRNNVPPLWSMFNRNRADLTKLFLEATFANLGGAPPDGVFDLVAVYGQPVPLNGTSKTAPWRPGLSAVQTTLAGSAATPPSLGSCTDSPQNSISLTSADVSQNPPLEGDSGGPCTAGESGRTCADKQIHGMWVVEGGIQSADWGGAVTVTLHKEVLNSGPEAGNFHDQWVVEQPLIYPGVDKDAVDDAFLSVSWDETSGVCTQNGGGASCPTATTTGSVLEFQEEPIAAGDYWSYKYELTLTCPAQPTGVPGTSYLVAVKNFTWPKNDPVAFSALDPTFDNDIGAQSNVHVIPIQLNCGNVSGLTEVDKEVIVVAAEEPTGGFEIDGTNTNSIAQTLDASHLQLEVGDEARVTIEELKVNHYSADVDGEEWLDAEAPDVRNNDTLAAGADGLPDVKLQWVPEVDDECTLNGVHIADCATHISGGGYVTDLHFQVLEEGTAANVAAAGEDGGALPYPDSCVNGTDDDGDSLIDTFDPDCRLPGNQIYTERDLLIECVMPGIYPVAIKAVDAPKPPYMEELGRKDDNIGWTVVKVYCWDDDANMTVGNAPITGAPPRDGIDDGTGLYVRWLASAAADEHVKPFDSSILVPDGSAIRSDIEYTERRVLQSCLYIEEPGNAGAENTLDNNWDNWTGETDADQDCLEDPATAQPGHPVDEVDSGGTACPTGTLGNIVYSEGTDAQLKQVNDDAQDQDCDGLLDGIEKAYGTNPKLEDSDGDGALDFVEMFEFTNPLNPDTDEDGILDNPEDDYAAEPVGSAESGESNNADDNCPNVYNPAQTNTDGQPRDNGSLAGTFAETTDASNPNRDIDGDLCDADDDNDGATDVWELLMTPIGGDCGLGHLDPAAKDTDGDHQLDGTEQEFSASADPCDVTKKGPGSLTQGEAATLKTGGFNVPVDGSFSGQWDAENDPDEDNRECDSDADGKVSNACGGPDIDNDSDVAEVIDIVEELGYNTHPARTDTDGDGCDDWVEIVDINGNRTAELSDVFAVILRALAGGPGDAGIDDVTDVNKNGSVVNDLSDVFLAILNSNLVKGHSTCAPDGLRSLP